MKINIATPAYGSVYAFTCVRSFYSLLASSVKQGLAYSFSEIDYADVVKARNYLPSNFTSTSTSLTASISSLWIRIWVFLLAWCLRWSDWMRM